jgi:hypothetical protein
MKPVLCFFSLVVQSVAVLGFTSPATQSFAPLSIGRALSQSSSCTRLVGCYATIKEKKEKLETELVNGAPKLEAVKEDETEPLKTVNGELTFNSTYMAEVLNEINLRISHGSSELMQNITSIMDEKLVLFPEASANELSEYIFKLAEEIQKAQIQELERQLDQLEKQFVRPLENLAFSDAPLFEKDAFKPNDEAEDKLADEAAERRKQLILAGANSTLTKTSRMKTKDIINNYNVAPLYYSIALLYRWAKKAGYPSIYLIQAYKGISSVLKSRGGPQPKLQRNKNGKDLSYQEFLKDAEAMQSGWKRTGEIAAKGSLGKKWAILRRSAEIWAYFSSFYLKDRSIVRKFESGKWSEERFREERSKLGEEVTQNLLRLGPTFIKVGFSLFVCIHPRQVTKYQKSPFCLGTVVGVCQSRLRRVLQT